MSIQWTASWRSSAASALVLPPAWPHAADTWRSILPAVGPAYLPHGRANAQAEAPPRRGPQRSIRFGQVEQLRPRDSRPIFPPLAASFFAFLETTASTAAAPASAPLARATAIFFGRTALRGFCAWRGFASRGLTPFIPLRLFNRRYEFIGLERALVSLGRIVRPWRFNHPASGNNLVEAIDIFFFFFKQKIRNVE